MKIPKFEAQTEWVKPTEFPDLRQVDEIAIDLETKDPDLIKKGSGSIIGNGEVIGIAVATTHYKGYFPIAHEGGGNMDRKKVLEWFQDILKTESTKIFHNAMYDVCWIRAMGFTINGRIVDTMIAAAIINENRFSFTLNACAKDYLGEIKNETFLNEKAKEAMAKGDLETAQTLYSKYMTVLDEYLSPPYPDYYKTQQHIWKCIWMRFGNRVIRGKLPQAPSNDFDSVD